jgi:hypothetical protein
MSLKGQCWCVQKRTVFLLFSNAMAAGKNIKLSMISFNVPAQFL